MKTIFRKIVGSTVTFVKTHTIASIAMAAVIAIVGVATPIVLNIETSITSNSTDELSAVQLLIEENKLEEAYKATFNITDKKKADDIRSKFTVIKDVPLSLTYEGWKDDMGNEYGPFILNYNYNKEGQLKEIRFKDKIYDVLPGVSLACIDPAFEVANFANYYEYRQVFKYSSDGKISEITGYNREGNVIIFVIKPTYENNLIQSIEYKTNSGTLVTTFEYNDKGQIISAASKGLLPFDKELKYDGNGKILEYNEYSYTDEYGGKIDKHYRKQYFNNEVVSRSVLYNSDGTVAYELNSKVDPPIYDGFGRILYHEAGCKYEYGNFYIYNG